MLVMMVGLSLLALFLIVEAVSSTAPLISNIMPLRGLQTSLTLRSLDIIKSSSHLLSSTVLPSSQPTLTPTSASQIPMVERLEVVSASSSAISILATFTAVNTKVSGNLYCLGSTGALSSIQSLVATGVSMPITSAQSVSLTMNNLRASTLYTIYCGLVTSDGVSSPFSNILATSIKTSTNCCARLVFTNSPAQVFGDVTQYASSNPLTYSFSFALPYSPASTILVTPILQAISTSSLVEVSPSYFTFQTSSGSLLGNFILIGNENSSGLYSISLNVSGSGASQFSSPSVIVRVLPTASPLPAPNLKSIRFADHGASVFVLFDVDTNQANIFQSSFLCSRILSFQNIKSSICSWVNSSAIQIHFDSMADSSTYIVPGSVIHVIAQNLQAKCIKGTVCSENFNASNLSGTVLQPLTPLIPRVQLSAPSLISSCSNLTIDVSQSSGSGGRAWRSVSWSVTRRESSVGIPSLVSYLQKYGQNIYQPIVIPRNLISDYSSYTFTVTLTNFFEQSSSNQVNVTISGQPNLPSLSVSSGTAATFLARNSVTYTSVAAPSPCANSSTITYSYAVLLNGVDQKIVSNSVDPRTLQIDPYTLVAGMTYQLIFSATGAASGTFEAATASSVVTLTISSGSVVARISGGQVRQVPRDKQLRLDATSSYDEDSRIAVLSFSWSCRIVSIAFYGFDCGSIFLSSTIESSSVTIMANSMNTSEVYAVTVQVKGSDIRYGVSTVYVKPGDTVTTSITTTATVFNPNSVVSVIGSISASEQVTASWSVYLADTPISVAASTPLLGTFSSYEALSEISFPVSFPSYSFERGLTYTLRLQAFAGAQYSDESYSEIIFSINTPPSSGTLIISPSSGTAILTQFNVYASGWVTGLSNYPLQYRFVYQVSPSQPTLTIGSTSPRSAIVTSLPPGLPRNNQKVSITLTVIDVNLASTDSTSEVVVSPRGDMTTALASQVLQATMTHAFQIGDIDSAIKIVNVIASATNLVDCSRANSSYCASLNRESCETTQNTCGPCLSGFSGVVGPFNTVCVSKNVANVECVVNSDCEYGFCDDFKCKTPSKMCPSSSISSPTSQCSGNGICSFYDAANNAVPVCSVTDTRCFSQCVCNAGYGGADCSLDIDSLMSRDSLRGHLCQSINNISVAQDFSGRLLDTLAGTLLASFSPYEVVSLPSMSMCMSSLNVIANLTSQGYLNVSKPSTVNSIVDTLSAFINSGVFFTFINSTSGTALAGELTTAIAHGIMNTIVDGQIASYVSDFVQLSVRADRSSSLANSSALSAPLTDSQVAYGAFGQLISLGPSGLDSCRNFNGYSRLALVQFMKNPVAPSEGILNPLFIFSSVTPSSSISDLLTSQIVTQNTGNNDLFYITLQFAMNQRFDITSKGLSTDNFTIPECSFSDGLSPAFGSCRGCNLSSYNDYNVTFGCNDLSLICDTSTSTSSVSFNSKSEFELGVPVIQSSVFGSTLNSFTYTISKNPFSFSIADAVNAAGFVFVLCIFIVLGLAISIQMDRFDHDYIIYLKKDTKLSSALEAWRRQTSIGRFDRYYIITKDQMQPINKDYRKNPLSRIKPRHEHGSLVEGYLSASSKAFIDRAMHSRAIFEKSSYINLLLKAVKERHDYISAFFGASLRNRRSMRWTKTMFSFILAVFVDTLFFDNFYPDNGFCDSMTTFNDCTLPLNEATGQPTCSWTTDNSLSQGGKCSLVTPPQSFLFVIVLALLTMIVAVPFVLFAEVIIDEILTRRPILESIGLDTNSYFGSTTASATTSTKANKTPYSRLSATLKHDAKTYSDLSLIGVESQALHVYEDCKSIDEEVDYMFVTAKDYLHRNNGSSAHSDSATRATIQAINKELGIDEFGPTMNFTVRQLLFYGSLRNRVLAKVSHSRAQSIKILKDVKSFVISEENLKNDFLIQHFVLEQLPFFKRYCVKKQYFSFDESTPESVDAYIWLIGWALILGALGFMLYYILNWTAINAGNTLRHWYLNFIIGLAEDIFFVQVVRIFVTHVLGVLSARAQLRNINRTLVNISQRISTLDASELNESFNIVQHMSGSCRAARKKSVSDLLAAQLLRLVTDADVLACRDSKSEAFGAVGVAVVAIPSILALVVGEACGKFFFVAMLFSWISGFILVNQTLLQISPGLLVALYVMLIVYELYELGLLKCLIVRVNPLLPKSDLRFLRRSGVNRILSFMFESKYNSAVDRLWGSINQTEKRFSSESLAFFNDTGHVARDIPSSLVNILYDTSKTHSVWDVMTKYAREHIPTMPHDIPNADLATIDTTITLYSNTHITFGQSHAFRNLGPTSLIEEAIRRLFLFMRSIENANNPTAQPISYFESAKQRYTYNGYHSHADYLLALESNWKTFLPCGQALSAEEKEEAVELMAQWIEVDLRGSTGAYFQEFLAWFRHLISIVDKLRARDAWTVKFIGERRRLADDEPRVRVYKRKKRAFLSENKDDFTRDLSPAKSFILALNVVGEPQGEVLVIRKLHGKVRGAIASVYRALDSPTALHDDSYSVSDLVKILKELLKELPGANALASTFATLFSGWVVQCGLSTESIPIFEFVLWLHSALSEVEVSLIPNPLTSVTSKSPQTVLLLQKASLSDDDTDKSSSDNFVSIDSVVVSEDVGSPVERKSSAAMTWSVLEGYQEQDFSVDNTWRR